MYRIIKNLCKDYDFTLCLSNRSEIEDNLTLMDLLMCIRVMSFTDTYCEGMLNWKGYLLFRTCVLVYWKKICVNLSNGSQALYRGWRNNYLFLSNENMQNLGRRNISPNVSESKMNLISINNYASSSVFYLIVIWMTMYNIYIIYI